MIFVSLLLVLVYGALGGNSAVGLWLLSTLPLVLVSGHYAAKLDIP
jgi:hypothetical protein